MLTCIIWIWFVERVEKRHTVTILLLLDPDPGKPKYMRILIEKTEPKVSDLEISVADLGRFGVDRDPDLDPRIHASD